MGEQSEKIKKNICMGLLAHVDAGKTTLSEALLYLSGKIRKLGRVDHKDAYLDTSPLSASGESRFFPSRQCWNSRKQELPFWIRLGMWIFLQRWNVPAGPGLCSAFD